ncbi:MAG: 4Fe-4S dicluster domain-containing protein [Clostridiales Family XIII bacterium]|jgi:ferredoxin|nr:4Fe-4S dicluster domain-containing protein [Clostridiales Family XIII bacterium]
MMGGDTNYEKQSLRLIETAVKLLSEGRVATVLGLRENAEAGKPTPYYAKAVSDAENLVWNKDCCANLAHYLPELKGRAAIAAKACDVRSIINLLSEKQLKREDVVIIGIECSGKTMDGGPAPGCDACPSSVPNLYDIAIGADGSDAYLDLAMQSSAENVSAWAEGSSVNERFDRFMKETSKCILCFACRQACQGCYCVTCFIDRKATPWEQIDADAATKTAFHLTRAMHLAGRCTDCGACEKVCPSGVHLKYLFRGLREYIDETYGFQAGVDPEATPVMNRYSIDDPETAFFGG